jgi:hypothetical protein
VITTRFHFTVDQRGTRPGLLKNAPLVAGSGWGRNDTPTHSDPVSHGIEFRESHLSSEQDLPGVVAQSPLDQPKVQKLHRDKCGTGSDQHGEYKCLLPGSGRNIQCHEYLKAKNADCQDRYEGKRNGSGRGPVYCPCDPPLHWKSALVTKAYVRAVS